MDLFEFTQVLRRQKKTLIVGLVLMGTAIAFLGFDFSDGISFRAKPRYEASVQMAVVPASYDSLARSFPGSSALAGTATLYATLLGSPEAAIEISEATGVELLGMTVAASGRDPFITVTATARDPEGSRRVALYSFTWLEERLVDPVFVVRLDQSDAAPTNLEEDGSFVGTIRLNASPSFADTATGLWISLTSVDSVTTVSLADAAGQSLEQIAVLEPDSDMVISLEDVFGTRLDATSVRTPPLPAASGQYALRVRLDRGTLIYPGGLTEGGDGGGLTASAPELDARHIDVSWQLLPPTLGSDGVGAGSSAVGLALLTENPVAFQTGARRGPVLIIAALVGGLFALVATAVAIDTWSQARVERNAAPTKAVEADELLEAEGVGEAFSLDETQDPRWNWEDADDLESAHPWEAK